MEEIEPTECDSLGKRGTGRFLDLGLEAAHPAEASEDGLADRSAEAEGSIAFRVREMIEESAILVTSRVMLQQTAQCGDAQLTERRELRTPDPSESLQWSLRIVRWVGWRNLFLFLRCF